MSVFRRLVRFVDPKDSLRELVLIVSSILIAVAIGNWNDDRRQRRAEVQMLKELRTSLQQDLADIESNARLCGGNAYAKKVLLDAFKKDMPYQDSLLKQVNRTTVVVYFVTNRAAYETLKSKGLDLISDDSLRIRITTLYEYTYKAVELSESTQTDYLKGEMQKYVSGLLKVFDAAKTPQQAYLQLRTHAHFRDFLLYSQSYDTSSEKIYRQLIPQVRQLIQKLDAELKRLED